MGMDITGICQKRADGSWITISEKPRLFTETRNREYFIFLLGVMDYIDMNDSAIDDLVQKSGWIDDVADLTDPRNNFSRPGTLTLAELADLKHDRYNPSPWLHGLLLHDLFEICGACNTEDFRIVFVFDN